MTDKAKRKGNPRRRLLIGSVVALLMMLVIGIGISLGIQSSLQAEPEWIVYEARNNEGTSLWIMDIHHPEKRVEISTQYNGGLSTGGDYIFYQTANYETQRYHLKLFDVSTGTEQDISPCSKGLCDDYSLSPDGEWLAYISYSILGGNTQEPIVYQIEFYHIPTGESHQIDVERPYDSLPYPRQTFWVNDNQYAFYSSSGTMSLYAPATQEMIETDYIDTTALQSPIHISSDGESYIIAERNAYTSGIQQVATNSNDLIQTVYPDIEISTVGMYPLMWYGITDWHSEGREVLITEGWNDLENRVTLLDLKILNLQTGEETYLFNHVSQLEVLSATFNRGGTKVIASIRHFETREMSFYLFDLQTGEETILPISGFSPRWVQ